MQDATVATHRLHWGLNSTEFEDGLTTQKPLYVTKENGAIVTAPMAGRWRWRVPWNPGVIRVRHPSSMPTCKRTVDAIVPNHSVALFPMS